MQTTLNNRLNHLDAVRAFALLLGVVFHASLSFMPFFIGWAVMDINTSNIAAIFILISHSFRLEVFFLIAGFFAHMNFHKMKKTDFVSSRLLRIAVPFLVFWFLLKPLIDAGWMIGANSYNGDLNILSSLAMAYSNFDKLPEGFFVGSHLWFLYYLLFITFGVIVFRSIFSVKKGLLERIGEASDSLFSFLVSKNLALISLLIPTVWCLWFMSHWGVDTPDKSLIPQISVLALYLLFFSLGWLLHRIPDLLIELSRVSWVKFLLMIVSIIFCVFLSPFEFQYGHPNYFWFKAGYLISYAVMMWNLVFLLIGVCGRLFSKPNTVVRYLADASYWMYLIHLPIVVFVQVLVSELEFFWWFKLLLIFFVTVVLCILSYDVFVRSTVIGKLLNGKQKPRLLFKLSRDLVVTYENS